METRGRYSKLGGMSFFMIFVYPILFIVLFFILRLYQYPFFRHICGISHTRGKEFSKYWPQGLESEEDKESYKWCRERFLIYGFNRE